MVDRLFSSTHIRHLLGPLKFILLSIFSVGILPLVAAQVKKHAFVGDFRLPNSLYREIRPIPIIVKLVAETLDGKRITRVTRLDNFTSTLKKNLHLGNRSKKFANALFFPMTRAPRKCYIPLTLTIVPRDHIMHRGLFTKGHPKK